MQGKPLGLPSMASFPGMLYAKVEAFHNTIHLRPKQTVQTLHLYTDFGQNSSYVRDDTHHATWASFQ
jgi:hypothetical protein